MIERKGAKTALITTAGFRDVLDTGYESRHDQYNLLIDKTKPLIPRYLRFTVPERVNYRGDVLLPLDEDAICALASALVRHEIKSVAVAFMHSYINPAHEERARELLLKLLPDLSVTGSARVCPEIREYERFTTASVSAYVQPIIARYLVELESGLVALGMNAPTYLVTSSGNLISLQQAVEFPVRLLESGPAGGVMLASRIAAECGVDDALSFDMGGTTAKFAIITESRPVMARTFEVDRQDNFRRGSGLPIRVPVIELMEIAGGGGSLAHVDSLGRVAVGPLSAAASPGPACYGKGGTNPTVTDADLVLGRIDPERFAGGQISLDVARALISLHQGIGAPLSLTTEMAAYAVSDVVDEIMSNASRRYAAEHGKDLSTHSIIAFGGAAPLHACRLARKLGVRDVIVPLGAGVGSAIGFLSAPIAFELVQTFFMRLEHFDPFAANALLHRMSKEVRSVVMSDVIESAVTEIRTVRMRYVGQGHEIGVTLPSSTLVPDDGSRLRAAFENSYEKLNCVKIPNAPIEILDWSITVSTVPETVQRIPVTTVEHRPAPSTLAMLFDVDSDSMGQFPTYWRDKLEPGAYVVGPALISEEQTTTFVDAGFSAVVLSNGCIRLRRTIAANIEDLRP